MAQPHAWPRWVWPGMAIAPGAAIPYLSPPMLSPADMRQAKSAAASSKWARSSAVEHLTFNQRVDGSIPSGLTNDFNKIDLAAALDLRSGLPTGNQ